MKIVLVGALAGVFYFLLNSAFERQYQAGLREGKSTALKTNPPSDELEIVCAGLWIGQQNKKYWERTNAR